MTNTDQLSISGTMPTALRNIAQSDNLDHEQQELLRQAATQHEQLLERDRWDAFTPEERAEIWTALETLVESENQDHYLIENLKMQGELGELNCGTCCSYPCGCDGFDPGELAPDEVGPNSNYSAIDRALPIEP